MKNVSESTQRISVGHSYPVWLPQTQTWMHTQVRYAPTEIEAHVLCEHTRHLDQFSVPNIHCFARHSRWRQYWEKGLRKVRWRHHLPWLVRIINREGINLLHSHFGNIGWRDIEVARRASVQHVVTFYGRDVNLLPSQDERWVGRYQYLFQQVDAVLCEGPHMAGDLVKLGCPADKVHVHHLGVRVEELPFRPQTWQPGTPLRVLIAASFKEKKGIPYALEALSAMKNRVPLEITLIGGATADEASQQEKKNIMDGIEAHGLLPSVRLLGYQPYERLIEEAYDHHLFLSPSVTASDGDTEGGAPVTLIEMASLGTLVVSTTHGDIPNVIQDGVGGLLAEERDVSGLVQRMEWLVAHPEAWGRMAEAARRHVEQNFDAERQARKLAELYAGLQHRKTGSVTAG